jgi:TPR repeat protein
MKPFLLPTMGLVALSVVACGEGMRLGSDSQVPKFMPPAAPLSQEEIAANPCKHADVSRCIEECQGGSARACNSMGVIFEYGRKGTPDSAIASGFYSRACDANYAPACTNLAWLYTLGHGVPHDAQQAIVLFTRAFDSSRLACRRGDGHGCMMAGELLLLGKAEPKEDDTALAMFQLACVQGEDTGCDYVREMGEGATPTVTSGDRSISD